MERSSRHLLKSSVLVIFAIGTLVLAARTSMATPSIGRGSTTSTRSSQAQRGPTEVTLTATELKLDPSAITVTAGRPARLTFAKRGTIEHDWEAGGLKATDVEILSAPSNLSKGMRDAMHAKTTQVGGN